MQGKLDGKDFRGFKHEIGDELIIFRESINKATEREQQHFQKMLQLEQDTRTIQKELLENNNLLKEMDSGGGDSKLKSIKDDISR